jgi:hypothetical protein
MHSKKRDLKVHIEIARISVTGRAVFDATKGIRLQP